MPLDRARPSGRELEWKVRSGDWTVVVMNQDASPGVRVDATVAAEVPLLNDLGWGLRGRRRRARPRR